MSQAFEISDTQTLDMPAFRRLFDKVKGRTDIWLEVEDAQPRRVMLLNDPMFVFPEAIERYNENHSSKRSAHWTEVLDSEFYANIGKPHKVCVILDDDQDASAFAQHLALTATKYSTFIDLPCWTEDGGDPSELHEWLAKNLKGRAIVWLTAGSFIYDRYLDEGHYKEEVMRWMEDEDTRLLGTYDKTDPNAWPAQRLCGILSSAYSLNSSDMFCRIMFREPNDAMLFRLAWPDTKKSKQPETVEDIENLD